MMGQQHPGSAHIEEVHDDTQQQRTREVTPHDGEEQDSLESHHDQAEKQHSEHVVNSIAEEAVGLPALSDVYEVEKVLDMRLSEDGKREFLIKWKGWGPTWNNWEPEVNILDRRMISKFDKKRKASIPPTLGEVEAITMQSKRRCAKQAAVKARMAARNEHEEGHMGH